MKGALFCHNGLGDGVNTIVLSHNLHLNGWETTTFQQALLPLAPWLPHLPLQPYPPLSALPEILSSYDHFFVVHNDTDPFVQALVREGKHRFPDKVTLFYLYPSPRMVNEPYYRDSFVDPSLPIAANLERFCRTLLSLPHTTRAVPWTPPTPLTPRKFPRRIALHTTSSRPSKNWPQKSYVKLALHLQKLGYEPVFIPGTEEAPSWEGHGIEVATFPTLGDLASYLYESSLLIGNDSGLGHLASALGLPTITLCRRRALANLWAPSFAPNIAVTPPSWIPNIRGLRLRDRHWKKFITVSQIIHAFRRIV